MQPRPRTKHSDVLIVVPAYNESATIARVTAQLEQLPYDYLVINDGSTDNTAEILRDIRAPHINLCKNLGIGGAVQTGYKFAYANGYDIAVQFDGDGQHDAGCIERLIAPIREGRADFVVGSSLRFLRQPIPQQPLKAHGHLHPLQAHPACDRHPHP